jgi:maltose O-acetyltransferase
VRVRRLWSLGYHARTRLNSFLLRRVVKEVGPGVRTYGFPKLIHPERIAIGERSTINHGVVLSGRGGITIGKRVRLSTYATLESELLSVDAVPRSHDARPIVIEDDVWIASGAIVVAGVTIGRNSVVAAGAVVTRDVPPGSLAAGIPATCRPIAGLTEVTT